MKKWELFGGRVVVFHWPGDYAFGFVSGIVSRMLSLGTLSIWWQR